MFIIFINNHLHTNNTQNNTTVVRAVPRLCKLYPGICLTTEEKARKNLSQGSRRMPDGTMKTEYTEQSIHNNNNKHYNKIKVFYLATDAKKKCFKKNIKI